MFAAQNPAAPTPAAPTPAAPTPAAPTPAAPTPAAPAKVNLAKDVEVINMDPMILRYRGKDFQLGDTGDWVDSKSNRPATPAFQAFLNQQADIADGAPTTPAPKPAPPKPAVQPARATTPATTPPADNTDDGLVNFVRGQNGKLNVVKESGRMSQVITEGGNAIARSTPVKKEDVATVVNQAKSLLPEQLLRNLQTDIGSAGYKVQSGDIDVMVEATDTVEVFQTQSSKDPVKEAKQKLKLYFEGKGVEAVVNGRNVSIGIDYQEQSTDTSKIAQVDVMVIHEAAIVAAWHQHGPRGQYSDSDFKGSELFMLISSIAKFLGLKFDAFGANLMRRDNNEVVGRTRKEVAKILLNPKAKESDLDSVKSIVKALEADPDREGKLAQARQDAAKGLMNLPETAVPGTAVWFRQMTNVLQ
jgi:hypothetical protein